jgi:hypothetical protein
MLQYRKVQKELVPKWQFMNQYVSGLLNSIPIVILKAAFYLSLTAY